MKGVTLFAAIMFSICSVNYFFWFVKNTNQLIDRGMLDFTSIWNYIATNALLGFAFMSLAIFLWTLFSKQQKTKK